MKRLLYNWLAAALLLAAAGTSVAQSYPAKPIRIIIPFAAGSGTDVNTRQVGTGMTEFLRTALVIDNRPGVNGIIAAELAANSPGDGYTLFSTTLTTQAVNPHLFKKLPYDALNDFVPIGMIGQTAPVLMRGTGIPAASVKEVIEMARQKPGTLNFAVTNTSSQFATEFFRRQANVQIELVNYKSAPQALNDVVSGRIDFIFGDLASGAGLAKAGRLQPLAVASSRRLSSHPNLPTMAEAGVPGVEIDIWVGLFAPKGTPPEIIGKLNQALVASQQKEQTKAMLAQVAMTPRSTTPAEFAQYVRQQYDQWGRMVKELGIQPE